MKKLYVLLAALCMLQQAHALIVSVRGEGEVPEQGLELTVTEGEEDILTGQYTMELEGDLLTNAGSVTVQITRSAILFGKPRSELLKLRSIAFPPNKRY